MKTNKIHFDISESGSHWMSAVNYSPVSACGTKSKNLVATGEVDHVTCKRCKWCMLTDHGQHKKVDNNPGIL